MIFICKIYITDHGQTKWCANDGPDKRLPSPKAVHAKNKPRPPKPLDLCSLLSKTPLSVRCSKEWDQEWNRIRWTRRRRRRPQRRRRRRSTGTRTKGAASLSPAEAPSTSPTLSAPSPPSPTSKPPPSKNSRYDTAGSIDPFSFLHAEIFFFLFSLYWFEFSFLS